MMLYASHKTLIRSLVLLLAGWGAALFAQLPDMREIENFRVPDFDANGVMKSEIFGERAKPLTNDMIRITGLRIVMYKNKAVDVVLTSAHCTEDRKTRNAFSNDEVKIERGKEVINGTGFRWESEKQRIEILNKFHMVMVGNVKLWPLVKEKN